MPQQTEATDPERDAYYRIRAARHHLNRKVAETGIENELRDLAAHCRSVAFLETESARRVELAAVADDFERLIDTFALVGGRLWAVQQSGWTPSSDDTEGSAL
jgi:hypothetical protein